jgi:hypothetical protein
MPIDYKRYPPNWKKEIVPTVLNRANNCCENEGCDYKNGELLWAVKYKGKSNWFRSFEEANNQKKSGEMKKNKIVSNPKQVRVILTIAHLDHDETNWDVKLDRLKAMCQLCHLRYDAKEKYRRSFINPI